MAVLTITEFNQNPSLVARLADKASVTITRHGKPAYQLSRLEEHSESSLERGLREGWIKPPLRAADELPSHKSYRTSIDLDALLQDDRDRLNA
jgi:antitoxin (DNA-binding transcriptional repressor) of toxin-antitoxin stability system